MELWLKSGGNHFAPCDFNILVKEITVLKTDAHLDGTGYQTISCHPTNSDASASRVGFSNERSL